MLVVAGRCWKDPVHGFTIYLLHISPHFCRAASLQFLECRICLFNPEVNVKGPFPHT